MNEHERDESRDAPADRQILGQRHYDPESDAELTVVIVQTIADAKDVPPTDLDDTLLYERVDVSALEDAYFSTPDGDDEQPGSATFAYEDVVVTVHGDGWILVEEGDVD